MRKRISKKLLIGLGSAITFGAVGTVSGFGVKSIIDSTFLNEQNNKLAINKLDEVSFTNAPDYNVAMADMFVDTTNLKRFHFGNTLIGQTVTPYGWLGVFDEPNKSTRIALTGWNGEVIWVNEPADYASGVNLHNYDVYDMEYDFKNDLIFVLRTWSSNGFINDNDEGFPKIRMDILDAKTGKEFDKSRINWMVLPPNETDQGKKLKDWQRKSLTALKQYKYLNWGNQQNRQQSKNLYQLDIASGSSQNNILVTWMPDFMRLTKNYGTTSASIINLKDFINLWPQVAVSWIVLPNNIRQNKPAEYSRYFDLTRSDEINKDNNGNITIQISNQWKQADQYYLIANPFFTVGKDDDNNSKPFYIMHILFADKVGNVYHKIIGWEENISNADANGVPYKKWIYDKTQTISTNTDNFGTSGGFLVESGKNGGLPSWTKREKYDPRAINANTRINKNMFDNNSIVLAYPYGVGSHLQKWFPIFNVAQVYVEPKTGFFYSTKDAGGNLKKKVRQFYFGRDIERNNQQIAHYPGQNGKNNFNQTYNRLISVSPFDNTFIYAEKPNLAHNFFDQGANDSVKNWAGFFIGKSFRESKTVRPFFIWNSTSGGNTSGIISPNMTSFEKLYEDGFTFDLRSFVTSTTSGAQPGLNLYFNQNGNPAGTLGTNGIRTRKIGMISDIFTNISPAYNGTDLWLDNGSLATRVSPSNATQWYGITGVKIEESSFSTINHSRADLEKWYPRTFWNSTNPSNLITSNSILNGQANDYKRAVASKQFNSKLTGTDFESTNKSIDLVSAWQDNQTNYNRLIVKRPQIKVRNSSVSNKLPIITEYNYANENDLKSNIWIPKDDQDNLIKTNLVLTREQDLPNVSFKLFSSWKEQFRMQSFGNDTSNISPAISTTTAFSTPEWIDTRGSNSAKAVFGKGNNAIAKNNNKLPLRLMLKIVKPTGNNLPTWFNSIPNNLFDFYPVEAVNNSETIFANVLQEFINQKTKLLNMSENNNEGKAIGLGNLKIEANLVLNPGYMDNPDYKIYENSNEKIIIDKTTGQRIIYKDEYSGNRTIYDQSQTEYTNFNRGGFGEEVKAIVQESWKITINPSDKIKVKVNTSLIKDELLRKTTTNQKLFTFEYEKGNNNLIITPVDSSWLRSRLLNFQRLINMKAVFEYKTDNSNWTTLTTTSDSIMKGYWANANDQTFKIPSAGVQGITKLRIRLVPNDENSDNNSFVSFSNYSNTDQKFISADQDLSIQKIIVDKNWISAQRLTNATNSIANIQASDITSFENKVLSQITNNTNRAQVKLVYKFDNSQFDLTPEQLVQKIQDKFNNFSDSNNQGVFALWNGTNGVKIQAKFALKNPNDKFQLVTNNNQSPNESDLSNDVKSDIKSKIDLSDYINQLKSSKINATTGSSVGSIQPNSINIPNKSEAGRFQNKSFAEIKNILQQQIGVKIKFQKQQTNGSWDSIWLDDLGQINTYSTKDPKFRIGFFADANYNAEILNGNNVISNNGNPPIDLILNLPKVITLTNTVIQTFQRDHGLTGNTKKINFEQSKIDQLIQSIKRDGANVSVPDITNAPIELLFRLGSEAENTGFLPITDLQNTLKTKTTDWSSNMIKFKFKISDGNQDQWVFNVNDPTYTLLADQNTNIKIYIHGKEIEAALSANSITVSGNKQNLSYGLNGALNTFNTTTGKYPAKQLVLQHQLINEQNGSEGGWINGLPSSVNANIKQLKVKVVSDTSVNNGYFVYGPEIDSTQQQAVVDLTQLATLIKVDPNWFKAQPITATVLNHLNQLTAQIIKNWENQYIWSKIPEASVVSVRNKMIIKYEFLGNKNLTADNLTQELIRATQNYSDNTNLGIIRLWDGSNNDNGIKIKARFEKVTASDKTIQFNNMQNQNIDNNETARTGDVNTLNVHTTLDFGVWTQHLQSNKTSVTTTGSAGNISPGGLKPPALPDNVLFGNNKLFSVIEQKLSENKIKIWWSQDKTSWTSTADTTKYDATKNILYFAFTNESTNLVLNNIKIKLPNNTFKNISLNPNNNNKTDPLTIELDAPAIINVRAIDAQVMKNFFTGNTKYFNVDIVKIKAELDKILAKQGPLFANAPLTLMVQVGQESFEDYTKVENILKSKTTDIASGLVQVHFAINSSAANANKFELAPKGDQELTLIPDDGTIPVFVNDQGIFEALKTNTRAAGSNTNLQINWPNGWSVSPDGIFDGGTKGKGLKLEFSFKDLDQSIASGTDINTQWVSKLPTNFDSKYTMLYVRIQTISNKYVYERILSNQTGTPISPINQPYMFSIDLANIQKTIELDGTWLNVNNFINSEIDIKSIDEAIFQSYEDAVNRNISLDPSLKPHVKIVYSFDGQSNLTKQQLVANIKAYANQNVNNEAKNYGILQLWNNVIGQKISATFNDRPEANISFTWKDSNKKTFDLDLSKVITTIDFEKVINWLTDSANRIDVETKNNNKIKLIFKNISAAGDAIFNGKSWNKVNQIFNLFGITIQYRSLTQANKNNPEQDWSDNSDDVNYYDEQIGQFQIRFKFDNNKAKNLKLKLKSNLTVSGTQTNPTDAFTGNLKIKLAVRINQNFINAFNSNSNPAVISGNTKKLLISQTLEEKLINDIKNENLQNNPVFAKLNLEVRYQLGPWQNGDSGRTREEFQNHLASHDNIDQTTNQVSYKLAIPTNQETEFSINSGEYVLHNKEIPGNTTRIKYFVNKRNWENNAERIRVTGTNNHLNWDFNAFKNPPTTDVKEENGSVYLRNEAGNALQLQFTTKTNASYTDTNVSNNINDLSNQWITKKPMSIPAAVNSIKIRIVPNPGFEYEPALANSNPSATVHNIVPTITTEIRVNNNWLTEAFSAMEIRSFNQSVLDNWVRNLRSKIKTLNNLTDDNLVNKIDLEFIIDNQTNKKYTTATLSQELNRRLTDYQSAELGLVQLWNQTLGQGIKINATYKTQTNSNISLVDQNGNQTTNFSADLNTTNIYTEVDITTYATQLEADKQTHVNQKPGGLPNEITSFTPPAGNNPGGIFHTKNYDTIAARLNAVGIDIKFSTSETGTWVDKNAITQYDPNKRKIFLSFSNKANNNFQLIVKKSNPQSPDWIVTPGEVNTAVLGLSLAVPKQISINANDVSYAIQQTNFRGHTKKVEFDNNAEQNIINQIKQHNKTENGNDPEYDNMPLVIKFSIGEDPEYKTLADLNNYLKTQNDDFTNRAIKYKFEISGQSNEWIFAPNSMIEGYIKTDNQSPLKIYINDKNIFNDLGQTKVAPGGTTDNFVLQWQNGIKVNSNTGSLSGSIESNKPKGEGLKIQFTFNSSLDINGSEGTDYYTNWVSKVPTSVKTGYEELFIRINVTEPNKYVYDNVGKKITVPLNIKQLIKINASALNQVILPNKIDNWNELNVDKFNKYEELVWKATQLPDNVKSNVKIQYTFNNKQYTIDSINGLITDLNQYETTNTNQANLGILQLWNGISGQKITTKFILADPNSNKYELQITGNNSHDLDFQNMITTIDFKAVIDWLKSLELEGKQDGTDGISNIKIPQVNVTTKYFQNKNWDEIENAFKTFGITIEYSKDIQGQQQQWGDLNSINKFDPNKGTFLMRFSFDKSKSKNIKLITDTQQIDGANTTNSSAISLKLKVSLVINLDQNLLTEFVRTANITGDTKNIEITAAKAAETKLIAAIKKANGDRFNKAQLSVQYYLGTNAPTNDNDWSSSLEQLKTFLASVNIDQTTNKIWYRFHITNTSEFNVDEQARVLSDHEDPQSGKTLKIKYYINGSDLETKANQIIASGLNDQVSWNFETIFGKTSVTESNQEVIIITPAGQSLKVHFTLAPNADYDNPAGSSANLTEINSKWISKKPTGFAAGTTGLKIKLVPVNDNYVYGPKLDKTAKAHNVSLQFKSKIIVNKDWLSLNELIDTATEINNINKTTFDTWENKIYEQIKTFNKTNLETAKKVQIKYLFEGDSNSYSADGLIQKINQLKTNYSDSTLGIVQLWNGQKGSKIKAFFAADPNSDIVLRTENNINAPNDPSQADLENQIKTNQIFTEVNLTNYINVLLKIKTEVSPGDKPGKIDNFNPPKMTGNVGTGFLNGKSYDEIATRLNQLGITIEFSKDDDPQKANWKIKDQTKEYDIQKNALFMAFTLTSSNLKIKINQTLIENNGNNKNNPIKLPLNVPKYVVIDNTKSYWQGIQDKFNFNGDTKNLNFDEAKIKAFLNEIKEDNYQASGGATNGDAEYKNAPLEIMFQVGLSEFKEMSELKTYLKNEVQNDLPDRSIRIKFRIKPGQESQWKLKADDEYEFLNETVKPQIDKIKIYINDNGNLARLKAMQLKGTQDALIWPWPFGNSGINESTGELTPQAGGFGKGLKLQFSFNENAAAEGNNPETQWSAAVPKTFNPKFNKIWIRFKYTNDQLYVYDNINEKFSLSLDDIIKIIKLDANWLNKQFNNGNTLDVNNLNDSTISNYEQSVKEAAKNDATNSVDSSLLNKFEIKYQFNTTDNNQWLTKTELLKEIEKYKANKTQTSLGILQLWNGSAGVKINAKFFDSIANDNYQIQIINQPEQRTIDTSNVQTTIDFAKVISWITDLQNTKLGVEPSTSPNSIREIIFPPYNNAADSVFNNVEWKKIESALKEFGVNIEWRIKNKTNDGAFGPLSGLTNQQYDPQIGRIQFQIRFDKDKAKNILVKTKEQATPNSPTNPINDIFDVKLDVKLGIIIDPSLVNANFINVANVISGDTKNIEIDKNVETSLITAIKKANSDQANVPEFNGAPLIIQYYLGDESDRNINWKNLDQFKSDLAKETSDQRSNKVIFRFTLDQTQANAKDFNVDENTIYKLHDPAGVDPQNWKVKYYINSSKWETKASQIQISGKTSNIRWNYDGLVSASDLVRESTNYGDKIFIKINGRKALQVQFSTKNNIQYSDSKVSDNLADLNKNWITIEPNKINPPENVKHLYVRLVATDGFIYEPAKNNTAQSHKIDETQLKIEIEVNPNDLSRSLTIAAKTGFVTDLKESDLTQYVKEVITDVLSADLAEHVVVTFEFNGKRFPANPNGKILDQNQIINDLYQEIQRVIKNTSAPDYGILQLWNNQAGKPIKASYALKDANGNYSLIDANRNQNDPNDVGNPTAQKTLVTGHINTLVDLKEVVKLLEQTKINVRLITNKNNRSLVAIDGLDMQPIPNQGNSPFKGLTWEKFEQLLKGFGIKIEARPVSANNPNWQAIDQIKNYDPTTLKLELRFNLEQAGSNIVLSVLNDQDVNFGDNNLPTFEMILNAPAQVVVNSKLLENFVNSANISGNTKNIKMDQSADQILVNAIIQENITSNEQIFTQLNGRLEIQYYLGKTASTNNDDWRDLNNFQEFLKTRTTDQSTNQIWYRLNVKAATADQQVFQINQTPQVLSAEKIDDTAAVKIFVHDSGFVDKIKTLKAVGSTEDFNITNLEQWLKTVPSSLEVQYSNVELPNEDTDQDWTTDVPQRLNSNKKLWIRFKSKPGYVFEKAKKINQDQYSKYSDKHAISTADLKLILKLEKDWLNEIIITGNTKVAQINEDKVLDKIKQAQILPDGKPNLVALEYRISGTDQWFDKTKFIEKLSILDGTKDENHFILKREELEVRFTLSEQGDYGLNIDGTNIEENNRNQFNVQMVDDANGRNVSFEGYINVDKISEFTLDNFKIIGTTSKPRFIVNNRMNLNNRFLPYASDDLFDIKFAYQKNNNQWIWDSNNSILENGQLIGEDGLIKKGIQIGAKREFALKFESKNNKYKVYQKNNPQNDGYILDISNNVKIVVEINNPFSAVGKTLGIWTRDENQSAMYYQGEGGFKIVVANATNFEIDKTQIQSAQDFLTQSTTIQDNEKQALEFVYHIFGSSASTDEIQQVQKSINDYNSDDWQIFPSQTKNNDQWSGNLKLRVGDYVAVAIRVKKQFSEGDNAFVLKDGDHSIILPFMSDTSGAAKKPGRVAGYKIKTSEIQVDSNSILLSNMINAELPPLDGWTSLSKLNLKQDSNGNYLGVNLKLQLYTEFYENSSNKILISGTGAKLVKRETSGTDIQKTGQYTDKSGSPIKDKNNQEVNIYKNTKTNRLSNPTKANNVTNSKDLEDLGNGVFRLVAKDDHEKGLLSLFKNQDIDLQLVAKQGEGSADLPDFYLDDSTVKLELRDFINPQIKYPVENEKQITYLWNYDDFNVENIQYEMPGKPNRPAEDGNARIKTIYKLTKKQTGKDDEEITGTTPDQASTNLNEQLRKDFGGQLKFQVSRISASGSETTLDSNNIYSFNDLRNKDRIVLKIVATENDLYYAEGPRPLIINVRGLVEAAPTQDKLQHLRVKQGGQINGQGSFKVLVSNPANDDEDDRSILKGWKFLIRVWANELDENGKRKIKIDWTDDQARIRGLENGDKVEWKLVSEDGNPVKEAYYNTIALDHETTDTGNIKYNFAQIQYQNGDSTYTKVKEGIGAYPDVDDEYPEDSGFIISGLKSAIETFKISKENFAKVMAQLQPTYVGINTQGTIHFSQKYFDENYWVNTNGELYVKKDPATFKDQSINEIGEISLTEFLDHVTFYTHDPVIANYQGGFKFSGNDININNHLTNGDQMWATFDTTKVNDDSGLIVNDPTSSLTTRLIDVNGLKDIVDPMSPLWYVLMALAGIATLGTAALIAFLVARHKKLKGKN